VPMYRKKPVVIEAYQFLPELAGGPREYSLSELRERMEGGSKHAAAMAEEASMRQGADAIQTWLTAGGAQFECANDALGPCILIDTLEGQMRASPGDWIIKGVKGEFYPCKHEIFRATYEAVDG
jgi:hypothetical protein